MTPWNHANKIKLRQHREFEWKRDLRQHRELRTRQKKSPALRIIRMHFRTSTAMKKTIAKENYNGIGNYANKVEFRRDRELRQHQELRMRHRTSVVLKMTRMT
ncbi:hypothetical protein PoB_001280100 [Plakobranchus ocellatus]|uniref:Uncharacterized protein n=1 Tax=Plakobranchus ocellatus TaxID=259542 RepID=A0AAV3YSC8_9GAST|nr:hypothetical protein PoB_001280100 [Plakobranchus ocellatus]